MFSYSGRPPGLSGVITSAGGVCPVATPRRPAKKRRTPGACGGTGLAGIDGLEVVCSANCLFKIPPARSCESSMRERGSVRVRHLLRCNFGDIVP